jgi:hypothetical protein
VVLVRQQLPLLRREVQQLRLLVLPQLEQLLLRVLVRR